MPGGLSFIQCGAVGKKGAVGVLVEVEPVAALVLQMALERVRERSVDRPFCDFDHDQKSVSFWPAYFRWRDGGKPGVYVSGEWSRLGAMALEQRKYRAFSPAFRVDNIRSSPAKVASWNLMGTNFGGLVNEPAFRRIEPFWGEPFALGTGDFLVNDVSYV